MSLLSVKYERAREVYEPEALRGRWSIRQLDWQIGSQFHERMALSKNKASTLTSGRKPKSEDALLPRERIKNSLVLESLDLRHQYPKKRYGGRFHLPAGDVPPRSGGNLSSSAGSGCCMSAASGAEWTYCSIT